MLSILQISPSEHAGGAERIAWSLHQAYRSSGEAAMLAVGQLAGCGPGVVWLDNERRRNGCSRQLRQWADALLAANRQGLKGAGRLARLLTLVAEPARQWRLAHGLEDFDYPASRRLLELVPGLPQIIHGHNLHSGYFDLRTLPALSRKMPVFLTLHDAWLLSGHCAHGGSCERWRTGCGNCPDLDAYPPVRRDATRLNWQRKARIYAQCRLHVATPCQWLMDRVNASMLRPAVVTQRVIPNGIDLEVFHPASRQVARAELGIEADCAVLLFAAYNVRSNSYKDYACLRAAVERVVGVAGHRRVLFLAVGEAAPAERMGNAEFRFVPFLRAPERMAQYYRAADLYLHAAKADTFPNTILEAMACGTAVVATGVGGIPEQVQDGVTGYLTPPGEPAAMAARVLELLNDDSRLQEMGRQAASLARREFAVERMAGAYRQWYQESLEQPAGAFL